MHCEEQERALLRTLGQQSAKTEILRRLQLLTPDSGRRWGKMSAHEMVCHLSDSFKAATGEKYVSSVPSKRPTRMLVRWIALYVPLPWPHGVPTRPEMDPQREGTPPLEFQRDVQGLASMIEKFTDPQRDFESSRHPFFGQMSVRDWLRWGYLHSDHHLRQFGL